MTKNAPVYAFVTLAICGGIGLYASERQNADALYQSQLGGCERQNTLRMESNRRIPSHEADTTVLHDFLLSAANARAANYDHSRQQSDLQAAQEYRVLARTLDKKVHFEAVPIVDCLKVIKKP